MRISEFVGLTIKDIDLKEKTINIDHQFRKKFVSVSGALFRTAGNQK